MMATRSLAGAAVLATAAALVNPAAANPAACRLHTSSLVESYLNPPGGGDEDFFTVAGAGVPNIIWLFDNSDAMADAFPFPVPAPGCALGTDFGAYYEGYDPETVYPPFDPYEKNVDPWVYDTGAIFQWGATPFDAPLKQGGGASDVIGKFCGEVPGCEACLRAQGWYSDGTRVVVTGNALNWRPAHPWVIGRKAISDVIYKEYRPIRMGVAVFDKSGIGASWTTGWELSPNCSNQIGGNWQSNREGHFSQFRRDYDAATLGGRAALTRALMDVGQYYVDEPHLPDVWFGSDWVDPDMTEKPNGAKKSVCAPCSISVVALISFGAPNEAGDEIPHEVEKLSLPCEHLSADRCRTENLHKMAWWLRNHDLRLDYPGEQSVLTYAIGFMKDNPLLEEAAEQGDGLYINANNPEEFGQAIAEVVEDVVRRSNLFTTSRLNRIQNDAVQSVLVPRFVPDTKMPWKGSLFRFDMVSEWLVDVDLDQDGSKDDFFLIDASCDGVDDWSNVGGCRPIRAAVDQDRKRCDNLMMGELYRQVSFENTHLDCSAPAEPFWEAGDLLRHRDPMQRKIWTVVDTNGDGTIDGSDDLIDFHPDRSAQLLPYLGMESSTTCDAWLNLGMVENRDQCAKAFIAWIRGCELDPAFGVSPPTTCAPRERVLGDIFHSAPEIVEPPTPRFLLGTAFRHYQSMVSLALPNDPFPVDPGPSGVGAGTHPYETFVKQHRSRTRFALVGSNAGMLHAFDVGDCIENCGREATGAALYDRGSGEELWAFVPPDLLPKLRLIRESEFHEFFVDGSPWVRNVWTDLDGDNRRDEGEYRTVAILSERRGGTHWTALDVTDGGPLDDGTGAAGAPAVRFLWTFPEPGSHDGLVAGQSWSNISPVAPPIGPIRVADASSTVEYDGTSYAERWIAALPLGYDPGQVRGRGLVLLDVYTGEVLKRFQYDPSDPVRDEMLFSFAAAPALTAWGDLVPRSPGATHFDTMVAGDTGGQVWVARMKNPDPETWTIARVFQEEKSDSDGDRVKRQPFFEIPYFVPLPESNYLRAYLGTGDRHHLRDTGGGECSPDNLLACARAGCDVKVRYARTDGEDLAWPMDSGAGLMGWTQSSLGGWGSTVYLPGAPTDACGAFDVGLGTELTGCGLDTTDVGRLACDPTQVTDAGTSYTGYVCAGTPRSVRDLEIGEASCTSFPNNRFYSIRIFGDALTPQLLDEHPKQFDAGRLTPCPPDATTCEADQIPSVPDDGTGVGDAMGTGWYETYGVQSERTATPAVVASSCAVWSSLEGLTTPTCGVGAEASPDAGAKFSEACDYAGDEQQSFMYYRNYVTGARSCLPETPAVAWDAERYRRETGHDPEPPPPAQVVTQISSGGAIKGTVVTDEGGDVTVSAPEELLQSFGVIELSADEHDWRHAGCDPGTTACVE